MIYAAFESMLVPKDNGKQNPDESYTNKYQKCVDDKFSKPFKSYSGEDAVHNFINNMIEESKYCTDIMRKHFNKELEMT